MDIAAWTRYKPNLKPSPATPWVDVILTDPPYGVRASVRHVLPRATDQNKTSELKSLRSFIPATRTVSCSTTLRDLVQTSSDVLVDRGLLVFLLPVSLDEITEALEQIQHKDFQLEAASLQKLSGGLGRVLVTLRRLPR